MASYDRKLEACLNMSAITVRDLPDPITASKADWLAGTTWIGFSPSADDLQARNECSKTIQRQFGSGYIIEYITEDFSQPNRGFENDPGYLAEREAHKEYAGRFVAVHRLRYSCRSLEEILGADEFSKLQDMWAQGGKRWRWSVAFPIIESYRIIDRPKAKAVLGVESYRRVFAHPSATLRPLNDADRAALSDLQLEPVCAPNFWIAVEDEFRSAERNDTPKHIVSLIDRDLAENALEGMDEERRIGVRKRAAWLAARFVVRRGKAGKLTCDECGFDPAILFPNKEC